MKDFEEKEELLEEEFLSGGATKNANRIGKVLRILFYTVVYAVIIALVWRMCSDGVPKKMKTITPSDKLVELYNAGELEVVYQKFDEYTSEDKNYGYFGVLGAIFIPEADESQIVFRYNNSTLEKLPLDYPELCPETPDRSGVYYDVTLVKVVDLTPDDITDNENEEFLRYERYYPKADATTTHSTALHNYFRYVFEGIDTSDALTVYVDIYYNEAIDYEAEPYGRISVFSSQNNTRIFPLTASDKRALKNYAK